ncbi:MAG: hypothetical protein J7L53_04665 [Deltaproteobacteria bacterium]|nr:hypothetical protein [Deltaproteobacteria bacterium]
MSKKFTTETILDEILKSGEASKVLARFNLPCLHCPMARYEASQLKIGEVAKAYGIDTNSLLNELNKEA